MKIAMNIISILLTWFFLGCSKSNDNGTVVPPPPPPVPGDSISNVLQYGTPFSGVPDRQDVVIYQVNMRTFSDAGNFAGVTARLDSIKALGANVIYLMPIYPVGVLNALNSPYSVKNNTAVNAEFGNIDDLRTLVDGAHSKGMSVIIDWVANHTSWDNPWITAHRDWYLQNSAGTIQSPPGTGWNDVAQLNFNNAAMRLEQIKAMKYWVLKANIDGFRCDYADGPPVDFWKQAIDTLRNISTHKLLLLAEGSRASNYSVGFDYNFGFGFFDNLKSVFGAGQVSAQTIDNFNTNDYANASNGQQIIRYTSNHDVNGAEGTPLELFGGKQGSMAAFVVVSYMKSVPMIYCGQEVGTPVRMLFPFTTANIDWSLNPDVTAEYKKVIAFRNNNVAIRRGNLVSYSNADVVAFTKELNTEKVLVLSNLRNSTISYNIPPVLVGTTWTDAMNGGNITLTTTMSLSPYKYVVLKK
ncbi:MAG: hypothetical protein H7Y86_03700 [Rhizobacter sp.]|nr:hypothetical protein [Ferruginibacter sp.]